MGHGWGTVVGPEKLDQLAEEAVPLDGLADVVVAAQAKAFFPVLAHRVGGDGKDRARETAGAKLADGLVAVEHRHFHVHDHGVKGPALLGRVANPLERFLAVAPARPRHRCC